MKDQETTKRIETKQLNKELLKTSNGTLVVTQSKKPNMSPAFIKSYRQGLKFKQRQSKSAIPKSRLQREME